MARKLRHSALETRSPRLALAVRRKPYPGPRLARGLKLLYRRNQTAGVWVAKIADGRGGYREIRVADADDFDEANGKTILNFFQAQDAAKRLVAGGTEASELVNLDTALKDYEADLTARDADPYNASLVRYHLKGEVLLTRPLALISAEDLKKWRNSLIGKGLTASSVNRIRNAMRACLELAMPSRSHVWKDGLERLPNATTARKLIFPDTTISALVAEATRHNAGLGLLCDVLAVTGMRPIQAQRLRVEDLIGGPHPRLMVSKTAKGGGRNRAEKKQQRFPVPITPALHSKLRAAAKGRDDHAPLLMQSSGRPWSANPNADYRHMFAQIVKTLKLPDDATAYLFRHSSIVRMLLKGLPTKLVADLHDTSEPMIRAHYGRYLVEHTDDIARAALLHHDAPDTSDNVVPMTGR